MGKRVLVADDSATIQRAFSMVFGGLQDSISLVAARSFDEALSLARQGHPDLVIADIALGNRTGYDLCAALKGDPGLRSIPVLILGSGQTPYDEAKGRQAGADGHVTKPFESQSLIDRVHEALARPAAQSAPRSEPAAPPPVASARPVGARPVIAAMELDDEYGEFTIERPSSGSAARGPSAVPVLASTSPPMPAPVAAPLPRTGPASPVPSSPFVPAHSPAPPSAAASSGVALRPSLIPGARPTPVVRPPVTLHPGPGVASASVAAPSGAAQRPAPSAPRRSEAPADPTGSAPAPTVPAGMGRTIMGLPAVAIPGSSLAPREARPVAPVVVPTVAPAPAPAAASAVVTAPAPALSPFAPSRPSAGPAPFPLVPVSSAESAAVVSARIDQKVAAIASRGPEYEAVAKLSREVIEQVVWEVVPELAELIIREHVERLANARK